jgi:hypothetical protein
MPATYEAIEQHLANVDFEQLSHEYHARGTERALTGVPDQLCKVFQAVKPILSAVAVFPLIPANWRAGLTLLITILSEVCPIA